MNMNYSIRTQTLQGMLHSLRYMFLAASCALTGVTLSACGSFVNAPAVDMPVPTLTPVVIVVEEAVGVSGKLGSSDVITASPTSTPARSE